MATQSSSLSLSLWCGCVPAMDVVSRASFIQSTGITSLIFTKFFLMLHSKLQKQPTHFSETISVCLHGRAGDSGQREKNNIHLLYPYPFAIERLSLFSQDYKGDLQNQVSPLFISLSEGRYERFYQGKKKSSVFPNFFSIPVNAGNVKIRFSVLAGDFLQEEG